MNGEAKYIPTQKDDMRVAEPVAAMTGISGGTTMAHQCLDDAQTNGSDDVRTKVISRIEADIQYHKSRPRVLLTASQMNDRILNLISSLNK